MDAYNLYTNKIKYDRDYDSLIKILVLNINDFYVTIKYKNFIFQYSINIINYYRFNTLLIYDVFTNDKLFIEIELDNLLDDSTVSTTNDYNILPNISNSKYIKEFELTTQFTFYSCKKIVNTYATDSLYKSVINNGNYKIINNFKFKNLNIDFIDNLILVITNIKHIMDVKDPHFNIINSQLNYLIVMLNLFKPNDKYILCLNKFLSDI